MRGVARDRNGLFQGHRLLRPDRLRLGGPRQRDRVHVPSENVGVATVKNALHLLFRVGVVERQTVPLILRFREGALMYVSAPLVQFSCEFGVGVDEQHRRALGFVYVNEALPRLMVDGVVRIGERETRGCLADSLVDLDLARVTDAQILGDRLFTPFHAVRRVLGDRDGLFQSDRLFRLFLRLRRLFVFNRRDVLRRFFARGLRVHLFRRPRLPSASSVKDDADKDDDQNEEKHTDQNADQFARRNTHRQQSGGKRER